MARARTRLSPAGEAVHRYRTSSCCAAASPDSDAPTGRDLYNESDSSSVFSIEGSPTDAVLKVGRLRSKTANRSPYLTLSRISRSCS